MPSTIIVVATPARWNAGAVAMVVMCASSSTIMNPMYPAISSPSQAARYKRPLRSASSELNTSGDQGSGKTAPSIRST